ncbi:S8 family peptidase [Shouchella shacheensis]|uniref:S8 family peptidase n=1 Tax=Shouchella shacheensis TaxID=1649580 RepID=UPI0007401B45|nr:S8 family peptidase [Shouchella shacheensis]
MNKMSKRVLAILIPVLLIGLVLTVLPKETSAPDEGPTTSLHHHPEPLSLQAKDKLVAEDLARTTTLFISTLSEQLKAWGEDHDGNLTEEFASELEEHPHITGFALMDGDEMIQKAGSITKVDRSFLVNQHEQSLFSNPYEKNDKQMLLMAESMDDGKMVVGEIDLSFVQSYVTEMAAISDSGGTFFVSGEQPHINWETTSDLPEAIERETVPGLGWDIFVQSEEQPPGPAFKNHQAVVKLQEPEKIGALLADHAGLTLLSTNKPYFVVASHNLEAEALADALSEDERVLLAEPNYHFHNQLITDNEEVAPNDEFYDHQWNLEQMEIEPGWNLADGEDTTIAIVDTGVDPAHKDLADKIVDGYNAIDDSDDFQDENGHGTHVAGIAAAMTNNVEGIAGVSWASKIMPIKVLDDKGEGSSFSVARGIYWAVDHGADVINMSLGDYYHSEALYDAIVYAHDHDVILITASGNDNVSDPMFPAVYPEVLTVAAVDDMRNRAFFSNFGIHIDVSAPGEHIPSSYLDNQYVILSGTSMASPHAAGLAALVRSLEPELSNEDVLNLICATSSELGLEGHDPYYGFGEIDVENTLKLLQEDMEE